MVGSLVVAQALFQALLNKGRLHDSYKSVLSYYFVNIATPRVYNDPR